MGILVKICGLSTIETLDAALEAGADMVGFVFFPASPRHVDLKLAQTLAQYVRGRAEKVALSVDADDASLGDIVAALRPDWLQLHGGEQPARVAAVKRRFGVPTMKVLPVAAASDLAPIADYATTADRLLFDARPPREASRPGGLGRSFDWRLLHDVEIALPFLLSGGLDADNVAEALRISRAHGADVSSGVEIAPGVKDPEKIRAFVRAARTAAPALASAG